MTFAELAPLALKAAIVATVFCLGMRTDWADVASLLRRPSLLGRSLLAMNIIMPLVAAAAVRIVQPHLAVAIAIIALSLSPVPPLLPKKQVKAGGDASYGVGLLALASLFAIVWIPAAIELVERIYGLPLAAPPLVVAQIVGMLVLLPLLLGLGVRRFAGVAAERIEPNLSRVANLVFLTVVAIILMSAWRAAVAQIGDGAVVIYIAFILVGLAVGHLLGGPQLSDRTVLSLATASRHPGVALAIAHINFPDEKAVIGAVLLYLIINALISLPYMGWRMKKSAAPA